jgi:hypothetical protein
MRSRLSAAALTVASRALAAEAAVLQAFGRRRAAGGQP